MHSSGSSSRFRFLYCCIVVSLFSTSLRSRCLVCFTARNTSSLRQQKTKENEPRARHLLCSDHAETPQCFAILPTNALRGKNLKTEISLVYRIHTDIILRAGTSIYASSGFGPLEPKPCGGKKRAKIKQQQMASLQ